MAHLIFRRPETVTIIGLRCYNLITCSSLFWFGNFWFAVECPIKEHIGMD